MNAELAGDLAILLQDPIMLAAAVICAVLVILAGVFAGLLAKTDEEKRKPKPPPMRTANGQLVDRQTRNLHRAMQRRLEH
jgi:hypothetical protein